MFSRFGGAEKSSSSEIGSELKKIEIGRTPPTDSLNFFFCFSQRGTTGEPERGGEAESASAASFSRRNMTEWKLN